MEIIEEAHSKMQIWNVTKFEMGVSNGLDYYMHGCCWEGIPVEVLQWLHSTGCPWDEWSCDAAACGVEIWRCLSGSIELAVHGMRIYLPMQLSMEILRYWSGCTCHNHVYRTWFLLKLVGLRETINLCSVDWMILLLRSCVSQRHNDFFRGEGGGFGGEGKFYWPKSRLLLAQSPRKNYCIGNSK